jgi:hypothetical protein
MGEGGDALHLLVWVPVLLQAMRRQFILMLCHVRRSISREYQQDQFKSLHYKSDVGNSVGCEFI